MSLQELIKAEYWRVDNLTPGLDLIDNFWDLALLDDNYELIREKLYFRFVSYMWVKKRLNLRCPNHFF